MGHDLEVPAEVPSDQVCDMLARGLGIACDETGGPIRYRLLAESAGRRVRMGASLADSELWDGTYLVLQPKTRPQDKVLQPAFLESAGGQRYRLQMPVMRIGRGLFEAEGGQPADLINLRDEPDCTTVSREHGRLQYVDGDWTLVALGTNQNRTLLNGAPLEPDRPVELLEGDTVRFGAVELTFRLAQDGGVP